VNPTQPTELHEQLSQKQEELNARLNRIELNVNRHLDADSKERAKELQDQEVVDALGNKTRWELEQIDATLDRLTTGQYGKCVACGADIEVDRLYANPYAQDCVDCMALNGRNKPTSERKYQ